MSEQQVYKVGDILESIWGYDATFYDYYKVVGVTPKTVKLVKLVKKVGYGSASSVVEVSPTEEVVGEVFSRKVKGSGYVAISNYEWASSWDGKKSMQTASGWY